jgi:hypothetical protein
VLHSLKVTYGDLRYTSIFILLIICINCNAQRNNNDSSTATKSKKFLLFPLVLSSPVTSWGFGAAGSYFFKTRLNDTTIRTSNVEGIGLYTLRGQTILLLGLNLFTPGETYILKWRNSFSRFPDKYWGLGNTSNESNMEEYIYDQFLINPQLVRRIYKKIYLGPYYEFQKVYNVHYIPNGLFDKENIPGRKGSKVSGLGLVFAWDTRNNSFSPDKGVFAQLSITEFSHIIGSDVDFTTYILDLRKFISIYSKHVLAFQFYGYFNNDLPPVRNMGTLGGSDIMRGYYSGRYRDKNFMAFQIEYRVPIWWRFGVAGFAGLGEVQNKLCSFNIGGLKYSLGGGIRVALNRKEKLNLRIDYGFGKNSSGGYVTVSEAF